ncbi:helix-turn-helix domain-containing protein [Tsukamurella soli]|uniref:ImmA/IrrE family metallo-endopeptidase n=1 Tax=Tsukamurella soli TaxID=644556 RepID=A0ABP8JL74_9ACTN
MVLDFAALGERVAQARLRAGLTQAELSAAIDVDRSGVAKIETGSRRIGALELARIAEATGERIEWFVTDTPAAIVSHRNASSSVDRAPTIDAVVERCARAVEFVIAHDQRFGQSAVRLPAYPIPTSGNDAETLAVAARQLLKVTPHEPVRDLVAMLSGIGVFAFSVELGLDSPDAATILLDQGAVTVVNGTRYGGQRRLSLAHELGHVLVADQYTVDWRVAGDSGSCEGLLDRFARALLLPEADLIHRWVEWRGGDGGLRQAAVKAGSWYGVDMTTLARRLSELAIVSTEDADRVRAVRTTQADIVTHGLVVRDSAAAGAVPRAYAAAVVRLYEREAVSPERALDLMFDTWGPDDLPPLPTLPESAIWQFVS